jgi:hypothetical protein
MPAEENAMARALSDAQFIERVRSAPYVFSATVVKTGASTVSALPAADNLALLKVDSVARAPAVVGELKGRRLTLRQASALKVGDKAVFYAAGWLYGDGLALVETAREALPKTERDWVERIARAELWLADERMASRLRDAETVLAGTVEHCEPAQGSKDEPYSPRSEHDPLWWRARIAVNQVAKGRSREPVVEAFFPSSLDEYWLDVPKLQPGQRGVFLLHRRAAGRKETMQPPGPALTDALDFQLPTQAERLRSLLKLIS